MRMGLVAGAVLCLMAGGVSAANGVGIERSVYVERSQQGTRALEPATTLRKGDKVVLVLAWRAAAARGFTLESAVPRPLAFQRAGNEEVEVSIDQGRNWGQLEDLRIGSRLASAEDVTHLRLRVPASAPAGRITYSAIVR